MKRRFLRQVAESFGLRGGGALISVVVSVMLARLLGPAAFGVYVFALAVVNLLAVPAQFGIGTVLIRFCSAYENEESWGLLRGLLQWSNVIVLWISLLFAGIATVVFLLWPAVLPEGDHRAIWLSLTLLPVIALGDLRSAALRGLHRFVTGQVPELIIRPAGVLLIVWALHRSSDVPIDASTAIYANLTASILAFIAGAYWLFGALPAPAKEAEAQYDRRQWRRSGGLMALSRGGRIVLERIDLIFVGSLAGAAAAGNYRVAASLSALIIFGLRAVNIVAAPQFSKLHSADHGDELLRTLKMSCVLSVALALPIVTTLVWWGEGVIRMMYGPGYAGAAVPLLILAVAQAFNAATGPVGSLLMMSGQEKWATAAVVLTLVISIPAYLLVVPRFGLLGAALVSGGGVILQNGLMAVRAWDWIVRRREAVA